MAFHCVKTTFHFFHENVYLSHPALGHIVSAVERRISRKRFKFKLCIFFNRIALSPHMAKSTLYVTTFSLQLFSFFIFSSLLSLDTRLPVKERGGLSVTHFLFRNPPSSFLSLLPARFPFFPLGLLTVISLHRRPMPPLLLLSSPTFSSFCFSSS